VKVDVRVGYGAVAICVDGDWYAWSLAGLMSGEREATTVEPSRETVRPKCGWSRTMNGINPRSDGTF
jgi:hypothetical protein